MKWSELSNNRMSIRRLSVMAAILIMALAVGTAGAAPGGGEEETLGNNLSVPAILSEGISYTGEPITVNHGFRGVAGAPYLVSPYREDATTAYFLQGTENTWQASFAGATTPVSTMIDWGDNLIRQTWKTSSVVRIEVVLTTGVSGMTGYLMSSLGGEHREELMALAADKDGLTYVARSYEADEATVLSALGRLTIHKITGPGGTVMGTGALVDSALWEGFGAEGRPEARFTSEVNGAGKLIYGHNLFMRDVSLTEIGLPASAPKSGWYRLTFSVDPSASWSIAESGSYSAVRNLTIDQLNPLDTTEGEDEGEHLFVPVSHAKGGGGEKTVRPFYPPRLVDAFTCVLEIFVTDSGGGQGKTKITVPTGQQGEQGSTTTLTAVLTDEFDVPLAGKLVIFKSMGLLLGTAITDASGVASLDYVLTQPPGDIEISATFPGDEYYLPSKYCGLLEITPPGGGGSEVDLKLTMTASKSLMGPGASFAYVLNVKNEGTAPASHIVVAQTLPPLVTFSSAAGERWSCSAGAEVTCQLTGSLTAGQSAPPLTIAVTAPLQAGPLSSTATAACAQTDVDGSDNSATVVVEVVSADLSAAIQNERSPINTGAPLVQKIVIRNEGPSAATAVMVRFTPPAGVTAVLNGTGWVCSGVECTLANPLTAGATAPVLFARATSPSAAAVLTSQARVSSAVFDPNPANDSASTTIAIVSALATVSGDAEICEDANARITATLEGAAPWTAVWSDGVSQTVNTATAVRNVTPSRTTTYQLDRAIDANGPLQTAGRARITVNKLPILSIAADGPTTFCTGGSVRLTANSSERIRWSTGEVGNSILVSASGTYTATTMSTSGCDVSASEVVNVLLIPEQPVIAGPTRVTVGHEFVLTASGDFTQYEWRLDGSIIAGANEKSYRKNATPQDAGVYTVLGLGTECPVAISAGFVLDVVPGSRILPIAGAASGAKGSRFTTQLQLHSHGGSAAVNRLIFYPNGSGAALPVTFPMSIASDATLHFHDMISEAGLTGIGSLDFHLSDGVAPLGYARILNDEGGGRGNGCLVPLLDASDALMAGDRAVLLAPDDMNRFRYNLGVRALENGATVRFRLRDRNGALRASVDRTFGANAFVHAAAQYFLGLEPGDGDSIELQVMAGNVIAYGTPTENVTNDPAFQLARRISSVPADVEQLALLPAAGTVPQPGGGAWRTALQIHNPGTIPMEGRLEFVHGQARQGVRTTLSFVIAPGATELLPDLMTHFGESGLGGLDVFSKGDARPLLLGRIYFASPQGGTSGFFEEAVPAEEMLRPGSEAHIMGGIDVGIVRLNVGIRTAAEPAVLRIRTYSADGAVRSESLRQLPPAFFQQFTVADLVGHQASDNECFGFEVLEGSALIYGALVDNLTNDAAMYLPLAAPYEAPR